MNQAWQPSGSFIQLRREEHGVALLLVVFVVSLATILVVEFSKTTMLDLRMGRRFSDNVQAQYILKSSVNLAQVLLELPKLEGIQEDWLGEPWNLIAAAPSLPIAGFVGEPRLMIIDEDGKIDLNAVAPSSTNPFGSSPPGTEGLGEQNTANDPSLFWANALKEVFLRTGIVRQTYNEKEYRTRGNIAFDAGDQVAVIRDWIDSDTTPYNSAAFDGTGIESSANEQWFFNRRFKDLSELALVPGMTLERLRRIAPFIRVSPSSGANAGRINVNTAPLEVLVAIGFPETQAVEMVQERFNLPITSEILGTLIAGDTQLQQRTKVTSNEFSIIGRVKTSTVSRWVKGFIRVSGTGTNRRATVVQVAFY